MENEARATVIESERMLLQRLNTSDGPFILTLLNDADFVKYIGDKGVRTLDDAIGYLKSGPIASYQLNGYGLFLVRLKDGGTRIGICGIVRREGLAGPDIGFAFLPQFRGQGYAYESAFAIRRYAEDELGLRPLLAITALDNTASIKLLEKLGLRFEKLISFSEKGEELRLFST